MGAGISDVSLNEESLESIILQTRTLLRELLAAAQIEPGEALVIGCSSSEVARHKIGTFSSAQIGEAICRTVLEELNGTGIYLAAQCCEHLNRALIVEKRYARENRIPVVNVVPQLKAGGSFATAAYSLFREPAALEAIQASAGMDIGDTLIGMHLKPVAVPVRGSIDTIGQAHVTMARTRPKYIGGERAAYY